MADLTSPKHLISLLQPHVKLKAQQRSKLSKLNLIRGGRIMIFMCTYQVDRDKQADTQAFFANMTDDQIAGEYPDGVSQIGRWHDVPNGNGWIVVETDNQEALTSWIMGWSGQCKFPTVTPVVDDDNARKLVKAMLAAQQG